MIQDTPHIGSTDLTRRRLLQGGALITAAGLAAACSSDDGGGGGTAVITNPTDATNATSDTVDITSAATAVDLSGVAPGKHLGVISLNNAGLGPAQGIQALDKIKSEVDWEITVVDIAGDATKIPGAVDQFVTLGVDAILAYAIPANAFGEALGPAKDKGIKALGFVTGNFPGMDHAEDFDEWVSSARIANYMAQRIGFEGEVAIISWEDIEVSAVRTLVTRELLGRYPGIKIVEDIRIEPPSFVDDARAKTAAILGRHPNLKAIWAAWDEMGLGANTAVKEAGRTDVFIVSIDGVAPAIEAIKTGDPFSATVNNDQALGMRASVFYADKLLKGEAIGSQTLQDSPFISARELDANGGAIIPGFLNPYWEG